MFKNMKIGVKILLVVLVMSLGTLLVVFINSYLSMGNLTDEFQKTNITLGLTASDDSQEALQAQAEEYLGRIAQKQALYSNAQLVEISRMVTSLADYVEYLYDNADQYGGRELPLPDETVDGEASSKYMLAPGVVKTAALSREIELLSNCESIFGPLLEENDLLDNIYAGTVSGISYRYSRSNSYDPTYDPRERGWYKTASEHPGRTVWLDTYLDSYGNTCITAARAFCDEDGLVVGVVASDVKLQALLDEITTAKIGESGYAFVIDNKGTLIAHPQYFDEGFDSDLTAHVGQDSQSGNLETLVQANAGLVGLTLDGVDSYVAWHYLGQTGWRLCISVDKAEVIRPAVETKQTIDAMTDEAQETTQSTLSGIMKGFIIFFAAVGIVVIIISFAVAGSITRPIQKLARNVERIGKGELDKKVEVESTDEIGNLAATFNDMLDDLNDHIRQLTDVTAEKERIGAELDIATHIQSSMLPCIFPAFPGRPEVDIYATMNPAKEVGGDFYDFFMVDDTHLAIVMADVSGKGVPAALFMVIGKTLIKDHTTSGRDLGEVFMEVNKLLCEGNGEEMFITAFEGVLDLETGVLNFVNAGHETPFIRRAGRYVPEKVRAGFVLAGMETTRYRMGSMQLEEGDALFQYTDGVTEATSAQKELYGMERLEAVLNKYADATPAELLPAVKADIDAFVGDAPQFDDITMLCLEFKKKMNVSDPNEMTVEATLENIPAVTEFVDRHLEALDCPIKAQTQIDVAIDELFSNIARYAYDPSGPATVRVDVDEEPLSVRVTFIDHGKPYDPLAKADPDVTLSAEDRQIGGLGIFMVKKSMDDVKYEYKDGQNILTIRKDL